MNLVFFPEFVGSTNKKLFFLRRAYTHEKRFCTKCYLTGSANLISKKKHKSLFSLKKLVFLYNAASYIIWRCKDKDYTDKNNKKILPVHCIL